MCTNEKLALKLAATETPDLPSLPGYTVFEAVPPDHRSRFASFRLALLFRATDALRRPLSVSLTQRPD
jgi:hypothetical protein